MPKIFDSKKSINFGKKAPKKSVLETIIDNGIINEKKGVFKLQLYNWEEVAKFIKKLDRNLKKNTDIRLIILDSALAAEGILDQVIINIYSLDKYRKYEAFEFLSTIDFNDKVKIVKSFKKKYKTKEPKKYHDYFKFQYRIWKILIDKFGKQIIDDFEKINEEINKLDGINKLHSNPATVKRTLAFRLKPEKEGDYLSAGLINFLKSFNPKEMILLLELRNIVCHEWNPEVKLSKKLKVPINKLFPHVRSLCTDVLNDLIGLKML